MNLKSFSLFLLLSVCINFSLAAQEKIPIDHSVYDDWRNVENPVISNNGKFVAYAVNPQKGDGNLYLYDAEKKKAFS